MLLFKMLAPSNDLNGPEVAIHGNGAHLRIIRMISRARRRRAEYFDAKLFSDPAWDMLLELYTAELEQRRISTTAVSDAAGVPSTTGLRWLEVFSRECLIIRRPDPLDARRVQISLSENGLTAMRAYFSSEVTGLLQGAQRT